MSIKKIALAATLAAVALFALSGAASAYTARLAGGEITSASLGKLTFEGSGIAIRCNVTLHGELNSSVSLAAGNSMGTIFGELTEIANCEGGSVRSTLGNWALPIRAILGTLPDNATGIEFAVENAHFVLAVFGGAVNCGYRGNANALLGTVDTGTNTYRTGLITALGNSMPLVENGGLCPSSGTMRGTFGLAPVQNITVS